jgi:DNA-binding transcriptional MocR family regulator
VTVLDDRATSLFAPDTTRVPYLATRLDPGKVVTVSSMSKVAWAGLRVGWLVTDPRLAFEIVRARISAELAPPIPNQILAVELVPRLRELAASIRDLSAASAAAATGALEQHLPDWQSASFSNGGWLWMRLPGPDAVRLAAVAERHGVQIAPGPSFSADAALHDHVRISVVREPEVVVEGIERLARAWEDVVTARDRRASFPQLLM